MKNLDILCTAALRQGQQFMDHCLRFDVNEQPFDFMGELWGGGPEMFSGLDMFFFRDAILSFYLPFYKAYYSIYPGPGYFFLEISSAGFFSKNLPAAPHLKNEMVA